jgi:hypothetical protein
MSRLLSREVLKYIGVVVNDYQFDKNNEGYLGFINIEPIDSGENTFASLELVKNYKDYEPLLQSLGMEFESVPTKDEMIIICKLNNTQYVN